MSAHLKGNDTAKSPLHVLPHFSLSSFSACGADRQHDTPRGGPIPTGGQPVLSDAFLYAAPQITRNQPDVSSTPDGEDLGASAAMLTILLPGILLALATSSPFNT